MKERFYSEELLKKTMLVEITMASVPNKRLMAYAILDEQSNSTLVDEKVVSFFGRKFPEQEYTMRFASSCEVTSSGQIVSGLQVRGVKQREVVQLPEALSCPNIADTRSEVALHPRFELTSIFISM